MKYLSKTIASIALGTTIMFTSVAGASAANYTVKSGDTLSSIALKYKTSYSAIMKENGLSSTVIRVGQKLKIGEASTSTSKITTSTSKATTNNTITYTVKKGDTLSSIASKYGTNYKAIMNLNGLKFTNIKVGQKLKIAGITTTTAVSNDVAIGSKIVTLAQKYIGVPYVYGGSTPSGFDCSGFIYYVFNNTGKSVGRMSAAGYYNVTKKVSSPQVGDLVFFSNTYKSGISHVGIYIGNGKMINASGDKVAIESIQSGYWKTHFTGYGRM